MKNVLSIIMILILSMFLAGCDKDIEFVSTKGPKADAGDDKRVEASTPLNIVGKVTAGDGEIVGYEWREGTFIHSVLKEFDYTDSSEGNHTLIFTVVDANDLKDSDSMIVTVTAEANTTN